jgi:uncharacterized protein
LRDTLKKHGIVLGIKQDTLALMAEVKLASERMLVAEGTPPQRGEDARLEVMVDTSGRGKPLEIADGRVDMRNIQLVINVSAGQPLLRRFPPGPGTPGKTVFGEAIAPPAGTDIALRGGAGTKISEKDPDLLVAAIDGAVTIGSDGVVDVEKTEVITSDIDYATGNVSFSGDLTIRGTVRAGFAVDAKGSLKIGGNVEETSVTCTGNLDIAGGAVGSGTGTLSCGGSLKVRHVERFIATAGKDVHILEDAILADINAKGNVRARTIMGGTIVAGGSIEAEAVGAAAETRTVLEAGSPHMLIQEKQGLETQIIELTSQLTACKEKQYVLVKDGLRADGSMGPLAVKELDALWPERRHLEKQRQEMAAKVESLDKSIRELPVSYVKAGRILPNTLIRFGPVGKLINSTLHNATLTVEDGRIRIAARQGAG